MLTCAWPSASAISATDPGPVLDPDPQLADVAAGEVGLEQAAAVLAGGAMPGADRVGVAGADQLGGLAQPRARSASSLVGDRLAVGGEDVAPDRRVGAGDAGRVAEARADLRQALGLLGERARPPR